MKKGMLIKRFVGFCIFAWCVVDLVSEFYVAKIKAKQMEQMSRDVDN